MLATLGVTACGDDEAPTTIEVPAWAKVAPEQIAEAKKHCVPVAFENDLGMRFVLIPAGTFLMGSPLTEESRDDDETAHEVTLTRPYYLQTTEVTNAQYRRFRPEHESHDNSGPTLNDEEQPVVHVSRNDAAAFGVWLSGRDEERTYRLPTEAEWERACRAGTRTPFWWGASASTDQANYDGNYVYGGGAKGRDRRQTVSVGALPANPWGLREVHGNAREWCLDRYADTDYPGGPRTDPLGQSGDMQIARGGAYSDPVFLLRAACRTGVQEGESRSYIGFRLVSPLPESSK